MTDQGKVKRDTNRGAIAEAMLVILYITKKKVEASSREHKTSGYHLGNGHGTSPTVVPVWTPSGGNGGTGGGGTRRRGKLHTQGKRISG